MNFSLTAPGALTALALAGLLWLPFAASSRPRRIRALWTAAPLGGLLFLAGVFGVQIAVQAVLRKALLQDFSPFTLAAWPVLLAVPLALVAGLVQETARLLATAGALRAAGSSGAEAPWTGALAGAAIGLVEAAWLLSAIPAPQFVLVGPAVLERLLAITFHIGAGALIGRGIATHRTGRAFGTAAVLHTAIDGAAVLYQMGRAPYLAVLLLLAVAAVGLYVWMLVPAQRRGNAAPPARVPPTA